MARRRWRGTKSTATGGRPRLGVLAENVRAVGFYESAGYDREDDFDDDRLDVEGDTYEKAL